MADIYKSAAPTCWADLIPPRPTKNKKDNKMDNSEKILIKRAMRRYGYAEITSEIDLFKAGGTDDGGSFYFANYDTDEISQGFATVTEALKAYEKVVSDGIAWT